VTRRLLDIEVMEGEELRRLLGGESADTIPPSPSPVAS
jgi:hypothetical protein